MWGILRRGRCQARAKEEAEKSLSAEDRKNGLKESRGYISLAGQNCPVFLILMTNR